MCLRQRETFLFVAGRIAQIKKGQAIGLPFSLHPVNKFTSPIHAPVWL